MKKWNTPVVEELSVMETAGGHLHFVSEQDYMDKQDEPQWMDLKS